MALLIIFSAAGFSRSTASAIACEEATRTANIMPKQADCSLLQ
jgi:hypothetical protein